MEYKDIERVNKEMKTTDIKGKDYVEVNQRIKAFRSLYPEGTIETEMLSNENGICVFKANVYIPEYDEQAIGMGVKLCNSKRLIATGHAYEKEDSSFINKTSYIENCETSAVGRALGMLGLGIDTSVASAEEVQNAINNQEPTLEDAENFKIDFGKHKGKLLKDLLEEDKQYVQWMLNNKSNDYFKKCYELLSGEVLPTEQEQDERIKLMSEINELERELNVDHDEVLSRLNVDSLSQLTNTQLLKCKSDLEKVANANS